MLYWFPVPPVIVPEKEEGMEKIRMSGKAYLLYLRARQKQMEDYLLDCFRKAEKHMLPEQEIIRMVKAKIQCELPAEDGEDVILKGVVRNLLYRFEALGYLAPVSTEAGQGYQLIDKNADVAA